MAWFGDNKIGRIGRFWGNDPTLVSYYQLNGSSIDNSGGGKNGTDTAVSYLPTQACLNKALGIGATFGSTSNITTSLWLASNSIFSYAFWVYVPNTSLAGVFISNGNSNLSAGTGVAVGVGDAGSGGTFQTAGNQLIVIASGVAWMPTGANLGTGWHLVVVTRDGTTMKAYLDGLETPTLASSTATPATPSGSGWFDMGDTTNQFPNFVGALGEVAIFSRTLSPSEIAQYYAWATRKQQNWMQKAITLLSTTWARTGSVSIMNAASRYATATYHLAIAWVRSASVTMMNSASRLATATYHLVINWTRTASVSIMNSASRYATAAWYEAIVIVRTASVSMMNSASRYAKATKQFIIKIGNTIRWSFFTWS